MTVNSIWNQAAPTVSGYGAFTASAGTVFTLSQPASLTGIWFYSAPSDTALPSAGGIWDVNTKSLVPGTVNNSPSWSGALGSGWVKCSYDGTITLDARADGYVTAIQYSGSSKGFQTSASFPVTSGIITAPVSDIWGPRNCPYANSGSFIFPTVDGGGLNWFVDVEMTTIAYTPSYTLHNQSVVNWGVQPDTVPYTLGVQFAVAQTCMLTGIWFMTPTNAAVLPDSCVLFNADTQAQVPGTLNSSPSWQQPVAGGAGTNGWVKCAYNGTVTLSPGVHYVAAVFSADTGVVKWFSGYGGFWASGPGGSGVTNGPLTAPNNASSLHGQAPYNASATLAYPATGFSSFDWGVDVEVTLAAVTGPAYTASMSSM